MIWDPSSIFWACIGGALIALATTLNLALKGRLTGYSSTFYTIITLNFNEGLIWKTSFLTGVLSTAFYIYNNYSYNWISFDRNPHQNLIWAIIGGFIVGLGTKMSNGCTSGHAVCGIPRFSKRSILATILFMGTGFSISTLFNQLGLGNLLYFEFPVLESFYPYITNIIMIGIIMIFLYHSLSSFFRNSEWSERLDPILSAGIGVIFGIGLSISGMCNRNKIIAFLNMDPDLWDPSLAFVMASALVINIFTFQTILKTWRKPIYSPKFNIPSRTDIDIGLVLGAGIFGLGWGLFGYCPGPAMINALISYQSAFFVFFMALGMYSSQTILNLITGGESRPLLP